MRPGSLTQQFKDRQNQTGPYYQLSYTLNMKSRTDYISNDSLEDVRQQVDNYSVLPASLRELTPGPG
jgi:hypothetical protein